MRITQNRGITAIPVLLRILMLLIALVVIALSLMQLGIIPNLFGTSATNPVVVCPDAWAKARASLPKNVPMYAPGSVPSRFTAPILDAVSPVSDEPAYRIVYRAPTENLFVALGSDIGNSARPDSTETIDVHGVPGQLFISADQPHLQAEWREGAFNMALQSYGEGMTAEEFREIVKSLTPACSSF